jgi:hypothetical protein
VKSATSIVAIYDFELFPYALGDVLTWNVRTAMRCQEMERKTVDIYLCADEKYPSGIYQRGLVNAQNFELFFSELYTAFGTHPRLGNIYIFRRREELLVRLEELIVDDPVNAEAINDYLDVLDYRVSETLINKLRRAASSVLRGSALVRKAFNKCLPGQLKATVRNACLPSEEILNNYFIKYIHSHEDINAFAAKYGEVPLLRPAPGCVADIDELILRRFAGKKIVPFHLRLRRLDAGYGGEHSYERDSDFLEWYDFLRQSAARYPEVEFVALGRLQEKPLELLRLPNVTSLRLFGMGLGHELTLMLKSDLFIGTSSGFAALANFSQLPHFITKMNPGSCHAYAIPDGAERLPFAAENQKLIYAQETSELLMRLLEEGLSLTATQPSQSHSVAPVRSSNGPIDVRAWLAARVHAGNSASTTSRFYVDDKYRLAEAAYLVLPCLERAKQMLLDSSEKDARLKASAQLDRIERNFPDICTHFPPCRYLREAIDAEDGPEHFRVRLDIFDIRPTDILGAAHKAEPTEAWTCDNWIVVGGEYKPLADASNTALAMRATSTNTYWHSERFVCNRPNGHIVVHFDAMNSHASTRHKFYIFEDGGFRSVGDLLVETTWQSFEISVTTKPGSMLELQIDQSDDWQWLSIRGVRVINGSAPPVVERAPVTVPMAEWKGADGSMIVDSVEDDCGHWPVVGRSGYVQTPQLPVAGDAGLLIRFEARTDRPAETFTPLYLFEGSRYRKVADCAFHSDWRPYSLRLEADRREPIKVQIDYPTEVESLSIRNFVAIPVDNMVSVA